MGVGSAVAYLPGGVTEYPSSIAPFQFTCMLQKPRKALFDASCKAYEDFTISLKKV